MSNPLKSSKSLQSNADRDFLIRQLRLIKYNPAVTAEVEAATKSLYRLWWQCLKESEDYAATLKGERGEPFASFADDVGDLGEAFEVWWVATGRFLFACGDFPGMVTSMEGDVTTVRDDSITAWWDGARPNAYLRIPLTLDRRDIMREVAALLDGELAKRQGEIEAARKPRRGLYPDQRIRRSSIEIMLQLWRERQTTDEPWWQTGERLGHWPQFTGLPTDDEASLKQKRRIMTLTVQRFHNNAAKLIQFAAMGDFPRVK